MPEYWPWEEAKKIFQKPDVTPADEVEVRAMPDSLSPYRGADNCLFAGGMEEPGHRRPRRFSCQGQGFQVSCTAYYGFANSRLAARTAYGKVPKS